MSTAEQDNQHPGKGPYADFTDEVPVPNYASIKGLIDRAAAAVMLVPSIPVIGILVVLTRLSSKGPGIFRQCRVGQHGQEFMVFKIRTMRHNAEAESGPVWSSHKDSRVTFLGRIMRRLHLDELPQLFNVIKGEMSLVGPRPERPEFVEQLAKNVDQYFDRLAVKPGITGLAQVNLKPDTTLDDARRKQCLDIEYIATMDLPLDLQILASTALRVFGVRGQSVNRLLGIDKVSLAEAKFPYQEKHTLPTDPISISVPDYSFEASKFTDPEHAAVHAVQWLESQGVRARALSVDSFDQLQEQANAEFEDHDDLVVVIAHANRSKVESLVTSKPR